MKNQTIVLTKGLPASGKSTWAIEQVKKGKGRVKRVNKDDLRAMLDGGDYSRDREEFILATRDNIVRNALLNGIDTVIVDDTNFEEKHFTQMTSVAVKAADEINAAATCNKEMVQITVEYKDFTDIPLDECLFRNSCRPNKVPPKVITDMHQRYIAPLIEAKVVNKRGNTVLVDIDGTLAHRVDRDWFDLSRVDEDTLDVVVAGIVDAYFDKGYKIVIVSGREGTDICVEKTEAWLKANDIPYHALFMRAKGDFRQDAIVKREIYETVIVGDYDVEFVLDDRKQVVDMWREVGLKCLQVAPGNF